MKHVKGLLSGLKWRASNHHVTLHNGCGVLMTREGGGMATLGNFWMVLRFILNSGESHNLKHDLYTPRIRIEPQSCQCYVLLPRNLGRRIPVPWLARQQGCLHFSICKCTVFTPQPLFAMRVRIAFNQRLSIPLRLVFCNTFVLLEETKIHFCHI